MTIFSLPWLWIKESESINAEEKIVLAKKT